ncbi:hypothetical protein ABOM_007551 [Aspergillus bombycis]|uniref:Uncharacterized protein n=1 Tax=Aspergillus bombycis TaxID=109264 RepID=A0A1F7ZWI4_9EURO|nr:hypothetical protein ABOM_007551 [Aspergillus bombycis]OGM43842.1 hypothetical protein ABOM_007551 [Aspergillus bombycis]
MFKQTAQRLYKLIGKTRLEDLPVSWQGPIDQVLQQQEKAVSIVFPLPLTALYHRADQCIAEAPSPTLRTTIRATQKK